MVRAIYDGLLSEVYDEYTSADARTDFDFWRDLLQSRAGSALELGCGTGRLLLPLLAAGLDVEGLDNSRDMRAKCRSAGERLGLTPRLLLADMAEYRHPHPLDTIFCAAGTFTLLARPGQMEACLISCRSNLRPGGTLALALDRPRPGATEPVVVRDIRRVCDGDHLRCVLTPLREADPEIERWSMVNEVWRAGALVEEDKREIAFRRPEPSQFCMLLKTAGFVETELLEQHESLEEGEYIALAQV